MQKLIKLLMVLFSSLILLVIAAIIGFATFINPNDFKSQLSEKVYETSGRKLTLNGDLHWSFFPVFAVQIEDAQLSNTKDANRFAQIKNTTLQLHLLPLLKKQLVVGTLKIEALALYLTNDKPLQATDVTLHLDVKNKIIRLNDIHAKTYQGIYSGNIVIDTTDAIPKITTESNFTNIQAEPLIQVMVGTTSIRLDGIANLNMQLSLHDDLKTLNGNGSFVLNHGVLKGIDVRYWLQRAQTFLSKQNNSATNTNQTSFNHLTAAFVIHNGVVENNDLVLQAPDARATGRGTADLVHQQLNYQLTLQRVRNGELKDVPIPLTITGSFSHPNIQVNLESIITQEIKNQFNVKIGDRLGKSLGKQLNNLLH